MFILACYYILLQKDNLLARHLTLDALFVRSIRHTNKVKAFSILVFCSFATYISHLSNNNTNKYN